MKKFFVSTSGFDSFNFAIAVAALMSAQDESDATRLVASLLHQLQLDYAK